MLVWAKGLLLYLARQHLQSGCLLVADAAATIYAITATNDLMWYRHDGRADGTFSWAFNEGKKVGHQWDVRHMFSGDNGVRLHDHAEQRPDVVRRHERGASDGTFRDESVSNEGQEGRCHQWNIVKHVFSVATES